MRKWITLKQSYRSCSISVRLASKKKKRGGGGKKRKEKPKSISDENTNMVRECSSFQVMHKFTVAPALRNRSKVTRARTSFQIASLQNHFNFLCVVLHPDRGSELWARWPDDKARPLPDGTVNKQTGSKKMCSSSYHRRCIMLMENMSPSFKRPCF